MGLVKIAEPEKVCLDPAHYPPMHYNYEAGTYEYTCPSCGKKVIIKVPQIIC